MTTSLALTLLGLGIGVLIVTNRSDPRATAPRMTTLRERAIEAQRVSAQAAQVARELAEQWSVEQDRS